jgi:hypothetical protein
VFYGMKTESLHLGSLPLLVRRILPRQPTLSQEPYALGYCGVESSLLPGL